MAGRRHSKRLQPCTPRNFITSPSQAFSSYCPVQVAPDPHGSWGFSHFIKEMGSELGRAGLRPSAAHRQAGRAGWGLETVLFPRTERTRTLASLLTLTH